VRYLIEYSKPALQDLDELEGYLRTVAGDAVADLIVREILDAVESLHNRPARQRPRDELVAGLRAIPVRNYMVFFRIDADTVRIVRILHGSRNITAKMFR